MSISSMALSTKANPDKQKHLFYNKGVWGGNLSIDHLELQTASDVIKYLNSKFKKVYYFRIDIARTFGNKFVKPTEIYKEDMDAHDAIPNCIFVSDGKQLKLVTTKAKLAKEFFEFSSAAKNTYVPLMLFRNSANKVKLINFK